MNVRTLRLASFAGAIALMGLFGLLGAGCSKKPGGSLVPNRRPSVELTNAPVAADRSNPYFYAYRVNWSGNDPDGRVDHFEYGVDPTPTDTVWIRTTRNEEIVFFRATQPDSIKGNSLPTASDFHVFVIRAVDDAQAYSAPKSRAFFAYTIAPTVGIRNPLPSKLLRAQVTPSVRIEWDGSDVDGQFTQKPIKYKYKMLDLDDPGNSAFLVNPDSLRKLESARDWVGWDSTSADTQFVQFTNLTPGKSYLFVVIGFDEAGAYSPVFTLDSNCLQFTAGFASSNGPRIEFFNEFIDFVYQSGGYSTDPLREVSFEVPTKVPINVNWQAIASPGSHIQYFRWMVDGNINDELPRTDERQDYVHWSQPDPTIPNGVTLRPFTDGVHRFYLECADNNGQKSLGILKLTAVTPSFDRNLLVVDDTRLEVDKFIGDPSFKRIPDNYTKPWPSRSELDTFLFAKGGYPWRGPRTIPPATISIPGLFAGYSFDTLGTRLGLENPVNGVLLSRIGKYKNLVWMVDDIGAQYNFTLDQGVYPVTCLWAMSGPGFASTLAAYTQLGGRVWLAGGGAAYASLINFDKRANNQGQTTVFSSAAQFGELAPSRLMYDAAHWQSVIAITKSDIKTARHEYYVRFLDSNNHLDSTLYVVAPPWSHFNLPSNGTLTSPNYSLLPPRMRTKLEAGDPIPPTRPSNTILFYPTSYPCEYIREINAIREDVSTDPEVTHEVSVLDTLFDASGVVLLTNVTRTDGSFQLVPAPTMTYYHGRQARQFVFSGFSLWSYARADCMALIDFVLQEIWKLPRQSVNRGLTEPYIRNPGGTPVRTVVPGPRTVSARVPTGATRE